MREESKVKQSDEIEIPRPKPSLSFVLFGYPRHRKNLNRLPSSPVEEVEEGVLKSPVKKTGDDSYLLFDLELESPSIRTCKFSP